MVRSVSIGQPENVLQALLLLVFHSVKIPKHLACFERIVSVEAEVRTTQSVLLCVLCGAETELPGGKKNQI